MYTASDLRKGLKIEIEGVPYDIVEFNFFKPGKGQAMYKCRIKNLLNGSVQEKTFREVDKIGKPDLEDRELHYSYAEGDQYVFIDPKSYEQFHINADVIGDMKHFLEEDLSVDVLYFNGNPIQVVLPSFVTKRIARTEPGARGDTATNVLKPAWLENDFEVGVPLFINEGDVIKIDTRTGKYQERVKIG